jgi:hypothetical protein
LSLAIAQAARASSNGMAGEPVLETAPGRREIADGPASGWRRPNFREREIPMPSGHVVVVLVVVVALAVALAFPVAVRSRDLHRRRRDYSDLDLPPYR